MLKNKNILVTGGAGFIGSHLVDKLLENNNQIRVLDILLNGNKLSKNSKKCIEFINGDVRDKNTMNKVLKNIDYVFHMAAYLGVDDVAINPIETMEVESIGTQNLIKCSLKHDVEKIIYISTSGVYGKVEFENAVNEDFLVSPSSSYAIAKRFNEIYLKSISSKYDIDTFSLRYFNVYGPRQDQRMVIPRFFYQAMRNEPITVYGDGNQTRDFTYIDDTVLATLRVADKCKKNEIFNVARGIDTSIYDLAKLIIDITNSKSEIKNFKAPFLRFDFDVEKRCGDSSKLKKLTDFSPSTDLIQGLKLIYSNLI